ncbi:uncharacterized protein LOC121055708 [Oryza brachyantha]|uniref:uncharacterized protein LOC121055708 n=1 Tax=Oryza brachyantha TaxID=4533 RepID=UPI001AD9733A|nr:uncharacterized protein LOC121055708 [Oryza brachyantha]
MAAWGKRANGVQGFGASSSSSGFGGAAGKEKGIRILDVAAPEIPRRRCGLSLGVDDGGVGVVREEAAAPAPPALARARGCDVYVGYGGGGAAAVERFVVWLCAEMEALGVRCVAADRSRCRDAPSHAAARAAMDVAVAGVVVVAPASLGNPYCLDEIRAFVERGRLVPVFVGLGKGDCRADDVVEGNSHLWGRFGGHLWKVYDGGEREWREAVDALFRADPAVEVDAGNQRHRLIDLLEIIGSRLGRRTVAETIRSWRSADAVHRELPFPRNACFVGRERELLDLESILGGDKATGKRPTHLVEVEVFGEAAFMDGIACISGPSGSGKTELVLEYAHRHAMEYKKVLWVCGEARYLRMGYLKLADQLGLAVGDDLSLIAAGDRSSSGRKEWVFRGIEGDAIAKIKKELSREIPYLLVIDNLESETDWWDSRDVHELLPGVVAGAAARSHVIITTTRLHRLQRVRTFSLAPSLAAEEAMLLMTNKGALEFCGEDAIALRSIEQKVRGVPLALALVGAILSELAVEPAELRRAMNDASYRAPTWEEADEPALRDNPGLVQLLDVCFALLDEEKDGLGAAAARMVETSGFFGPSPIPVALLAAAAGGEPKRRLWKQMKLALRLSCSSRRASKAASGRRASAEPEPLVALLRLGIARRCTRATTVSVQRVFALFGRKIVGSGQEAARRAVRAVAALASVEEHAEHAWEACLSVFKFAPAVAIDLPTKELPQFVTRLAVPLTAHGVTAYSSYAAVTDLLVEAADAVRAEEERFVASGSVNLDPPLYHELALSRAELMKMRAKLMLRGGEFTLAENHILTAITILDVVSGDDHPETLAARATLDHILQVQPE